MGFAPGQVDGYFYLANTFYAMGEKEAAIESYRKVTELAPEDTYAHSNLGVCLSDVGKHDEALASHEQARKLAPKEIRVLVNLAKAQLAKKHRRVHQGCCAVLKATLKLDPANSEAKMGLELAEMGVAKKVDGDYEIQGEQGHKETADEGVAA